MKIAIYLRKSRAEELTDTVDETLKRHRETLMNFAKKQQLCIIEIYEEVVSGENLYTRVEMLRLLSDVEKGLFDAVLCMDIDRLGRGAMSQQGIILETLKSADTKIITPRKVYDLNNDLDEEYTEFQTFFARRELKTINRRMRQGINKTITDGGYIANAPYGYRKCRIGKLPSLEIVQYEADFVAMIYDLYVNQGMGCQSIASTVTSMGAIPRRGIAFSRSTIMTILKNNVYIGKVSWNKKQHIKPQTIGGKQLTLSNDCAQWVVTDGIHSPIITEEIYERAQKIACCRYHPPISNKAQVNPLAGLILCAKCGKKMQYRPHNDGAKAHLICTSAGCIKSTQFCCVEPLVVEAIKPFLSAIKVDSSLLLPQVGSEYEAAMQKLDREVGKIRNQRDKLHDLLEQGVYSVGIFDERNSALSDKLTQVLRAKERLAECVSVTNTSAVNQAETAFDIYCMSMPSEKNTLLKSIISSIVYYKQPDWRSNQFLLKITLKNT